MSQRFPPANSVFIDVDGTLVINGKINLGLLDWIKGRKEDGCEVVLWSARGRQHAEDLAEQWGVADVFDAIVSKPGYIVDDLGWTWTQYTRAMHPKSIA